MTNTDHTPLAEPVSPREIPDAAIAMLDAEGTVVGWTHAARQLVGYTAREVVGRSAAHVLPPPEDVLRAASHAEQCRAQGGWSGTVAVRHRVGHTLKMTLRLSLLWGQDASTQWLVSVTDIGTLSSGATNGPVRESLLARAPIGILVHDLQLRCTLVDDVMEHHVGVPRDRWFGRHLKDLFPGFEAEALEAVMRQVLESGSTKVHEYRAWPPASRGRAHVFSASFFCLQDADGETLAVCSLSVDVTGNRRARERLAILSEASTRIGSTLDVMQTGQELANLAVPLLADHALVDLVESVPFGVEPSGRIGTTSSRPPLLRRAGLATIDPDVPELPWVREEVIHVHPASSFANALRTGGAHLEPVLDTHAGPWVDHDPTLAQKVRDTGVHSLMVVPIRARRRVLGLALFFRSEEQKPFQEDDLLLAEELVTRAALCLDNALQYARERTAALTLQRDLLPRRVGGGAAVDVASRYVPADMDHGVGGDWFDVIKLSGARVALVVGDVVGHGINAAATMGRLRTAVRTLADMELPPHELLTHLDDTVRRLNEEDADAPDQDPAVVGATCLYAVYDPATRRCTMARAGHPPPAIIDPQGHVIFPDMPAGAPLGLGLGLVPFESVELELPEGTLLALYTDGLVESRDDDIDVGLDRLGAALARTGSSLEELCSQVIEALPSQAPADDVTLLLARTHGLEPAQVASWELPNEPAAVRNARQAAVHQLSEWGLEYLVSTVELIVSELVTNAIRHGGGPIRLRLIQHQVLTCEVSDSNTSHPRPRHPHNIDENGRGLFLVAQLSRRWGSRSTTDGKVVWAEQHLPIKAVAV
ncbi:MULTISPECIES: SpoIIE family protein phosphatase [unclassified Streptomyces]|uniref:SpoIIE family protein phosphatase n=1 Tax=unclassified Streptomyces TaxID=2593676 RepID=UPI002DD8812A|nr:MULTISPECIES: SpoIIE family protein phosphatase [unclassified Streptomyces]WSD29259.1 PAS domain-containing SpoIIE family protein phosphatase/ATP-binding protein [Streptomyces sp. NBC_01751]WSF82412.1 PAS domain-containing SpoIIE family protein phosphatase/ATP-binding protein [Streptomyces sp. NBC_01744]WSJ55998.1 PAS domain-containing SpoIIE family protein phosphatase/ATP-binding protein [Streptomyces sp. NBC_01318]